MNSRQKYIAGQFERVQKSIVEPGNGSIHATIKISHMGEATNFINITPEQVDKIQELLTGVKVTK